MSRPAPPRRTAVVVAFLAALAAAIPAPALDVVAVGRTPPLDGPVLDLAFFGDERLVVLGPETVALYVWDGAALAALSRHPLPGPLETVRFPGGLLRMEESDGAFWALTSRSPRAFLFAVEDGRLVERQDAAVLPWPGCPAGLRYRSGTNLVEGVIAGAPTGPYLGLDDSVPQVAVTADGILQTGAGAGPRAGPALAALWPGTLAASSPVPPGGDDAILIIDTAAADGPRVLDSFSVEGAVRALAARPRGVSVRVVAAVEEPDRTFRLLVIDLARPRP